MLGFVDPLGLAIVFGGSALVTAMRSTGEDVGRAFAALKPLVSANPARDGHAARAAVGKVTRLAEIKGIAVVDRLETTQVYLRRATRALANADEPADFAHWGEEDLREREERHGAAAAVWRSLADAAPAMGLAGTIVGLVRMFAAMDDPAGLGPGMALALLTSFYGVLLANLIAGPVAARLERLSAAEIAWQRRTLGALTRLAESELPSVSTPRVELRRVA